jgi:hypothetical protein
MSKYQSLYSWRRQGPGIVLTRLEDGRTKWLQGDDADLEETQLDVIDRSVRLHRMGQGRANRLTDERISEYFDDYQPGDAAKVLAFMRN